MADQYGLFFNSINGDRVYDADSFSEWLNKFFTTGVFNGELQVTADSGMAVNVASGYANINGKVRFFEQSQTFTLDPASGVYPRIDTIVVRLDTTNRMITTEYVKGDYSGNNPQPTEPTRTGGLYEIVLAQIYVSAGATQILTNDITDTRSDDSVCGWVTSTVEGVPMDQIVSQMQAEFETWYDHMKDQLSEDAAGNLQLQIDETNTRIDGVDTEIGDTDISAVGDGTITGAVSALNSSVILFKNVQRVVNQNNTSDVWNMNTAFPPKDGYSRVIVGLRSDKQECIVTGWKYNENGEPQWMVRKLASGSVSNVTYYATLLYMPDANVWR